MEKCNSNDPPQVLDVPTSEADLVHLIVSEVEHSMRHTMKTKKVNFTLTDSFWVAPMMKSPSGLVMKGRVVESTGATIYLEHEFKPLPTSTPMTMQIGLTKEQKMFCEVDSLIFTSTGLAAEDVSTLAKWKDIRRPGQVVKLASEIISDWQAACYARILVGAGDPNSRGSIMMRITAANATTSHDPDKTVDPVEAQDGSAALRRMGNAAAKKFVPRKRRRGPLQKTPDCGVCIMCKDKVKFGGPGKRKQQCTVKMRAYLESKDKIQCVKKINNKRKRVILDDDDDDNKETAVADKEKPTTSQEQTMDDVEVQPYIFGVNDRAWVNHPNKTFHNEKVTVTEVFTDPPRCTILRLDGTTKTKVKISRLSSTPLVLTGVV